jgi:hypothetical protein
MMSDVLFEAIEDIEKWQRDFPHWYDSHKEAIEPVKQAWRHCESASTRLPSRTVKPSAIQRASISRVEHQLGAVLRGGPPFSDAKPLPNSDNPLK